MIIGKVVEKNPRGLSWSMKLFLAPTKNSIFGLGGRHLFVTTPPVHQQKLALIVAFI